MYKLFLRLRSVYPSISFVLCGCLETGYVSFVIIVSNGTTIFLSFIRTLGVFTGWTLLDCDCEEYLNFNVSTWCPNLDNGRLY